MKIASRAHLVRMGAREPRTRNRALPEHAGMRHGHARENARRLRQMDRAEWRQWRLKA